MSAEVNCKAVSLHAYRDMVRTEKVKPFGMIQKVRGLVSKLMPLGTAQRFSFKESWQGLGGSPAWSRCRDARLSCSPTMLFIPLPPGLAIPLSKFSC
jgi:hypothetical protein